MKANGETAFIYMYNECFFSLFLLGKYHIETGYVYLERQKLYFKNYFSANIWEVIIWGNDQSYSASSQGTFQKPTQRLQGDDFVAI